MPEYAAFFYTTGEKCGLEEIKRKTADLKKLGKVLKEMAARCTGDEVPECPVIDALFKR